MESAHTGSFYGDIILDNYKKLIATYLFDCSNSEILADLKRVKVEVYESFDGDFYAYPNVGIKDKSGQALYVDFIAKSENEAINGSLKQVNSLMRKYYDTLVPKSDFIFRKLEFIKEKMKIDYSFEEKNLFDSWRDDKLCYNMKGGCYTEFQLETDGKYTHWHKDSIFIGDEVFHPVYDIFCREPHDFNTYGPNLFKVSELVKLKEKVINKLTLLKSIDSLSEYIEKVHRIYKSHHEPNIVTWKEIRDSSIEFLFAVIDIIDQGISEKRALFVLGP